MRGEEEEKTMMMKTMKWVKRGKKKKKTWENKIRKK